MEVASPSSTADNRVRSIRVDPNLPRWVCQHCRQSLCVVGVESYADKFFNESSRSGIQGSSVTGSVMGSSRMDQSFVVLPKQKNQVHGGGPPRPRITGAQMPSDGGQPGKAMEESFVVLPPAAASMYKPESPSDGSGTHLPPPGMNLTNASGFHSSMTILKRAFEIATGQTQVEQPLCLECMRVLCDKYDKEVEDVNRDIRAYEDCLQRIEGEPRDILSEADFLKEKAKIEEEQRRMEAAISEIEEQVGKVNIELKDLKSKSKLFKELEERMAMHKDPKVADYQVWQNGEANWNPRVRRDHMVGEVSRGNHLSAGSVGG